MMDETKVQIGDDVLLDIGTHSDWYISTICYDNESVNVELRRKTDRNNKWWIAEQTEPTTEDCSTVDKDINVRSKDEPWTERSSE